MRGGHAGRAGLLAEAQEVANSMPAGPSPVVWRAYLAACRVHGAMELRRGDGWPMKIISPRDGNFRRERERERERRAGAPSSPSWGWVAWERHLSSRRKFPS